MTQGHTAQLHILLHSQKVMVNFVQSHLWLSCAVTALSLWEWPPLECCYATQPE